MSFSLLPSVLHGAMSSLEELNGHPTLTGYRFLCIMTGVGYLLAKSVLTYLYQPESLINIADMVYGICSIGVLFWLGLYEHRPHLVPHSLYRFLFKESVWKYLRISSPSASSTFIQLVNVQESSRRDNEMRITAQAHNFNFERTSDFALLNCNLEVLPLPLG
ncbi:hypothetical protein DL96DRAFT_490503 [Flagelloscypha sp. PMI_526]|nr:hypothetical protein DL96DRAFT_490503 [Flagelloscypha sp. PMI_526]